MNADHGRDPMGPPPGHRGFSLLEILIALTVATVVVGAAYSLLIVNSRLYGHHRETRDVWESLRAGGAVLASEIRELSGAGGDLYVIAAESLVIRSRYASGIVCSDPSQDIFGLREVSGEFGASSGDSALVYLPGPDGFATLDILQAWNSAGSAQTVSPVCYWGDSTTSMPRPVAAVKLAGTGIDDVAVGSGLAAFRRVTYGLFASEGRWWLGRRVEDGSPELLAGPFLSPGNGGLSFSYFDASGSATGDPASVERVEVVLRGESFGGSRFQGAGAPTRRDTLSLLVHLRNDGS